LHHLRVKGQIRLERNPERAEQLAQQAWQLGVLELTLATLADSVITHSITEAEWMRRLPCIEDKGKVHVVPWSVPVQPGQKPFRERQGIAFVGGFSHEPNIDAARWLVDEAMPLVWQEAPEINCLFVGSDMAEEVRRHLERPRVKVLGRVENLADVFERVRLTVAPLRFGGGIKDKVIRSLGAGLPCVGTPEAFRGMAQLPFELTRNCVRKTARGLAAAIVKMHQDEVKNRNFAHVGLRYVGAAYNQLRIDALIQQVAEPALNRYHARRSSRNLPHSVHGVGKEEVTILTFGKERCDRRAYQEIPKEQTIQTITSVIFEDRPRTPCAARTSAPARDLATGPALKIA
jgi:O-antigen biosynthesis protein